MNFEDDFAALLDSYSKMLETSFEKLRAANLSTQSKDYSKLIANRLRAFYQAQFKAKEFLGKQVAQSGSDFFVETIIFALKLFIETEGLDLERPLKRERKSIRPDISLWRGDSCLCVVECKTQLGYQRFSWLNQFEDREASYKQSFQMRRCFSW